MGVCIEIMIQRHFQDLTGVACYVLSVIIWVELFPYRYVEPMILV